MQEGPLPWLCLSKDARPTGGTANDPAHSLMTVRALPAFRLQSFCRGGIHRHHSVWNAVESVRLSDARASLHLHDLALGIHESCTISAGHWKVSFFVFCHAIFGVMLSPAQECLLSYPSLIGIRPHACMLTLSVSVRVKIHGGATHTFEVHPEFEVLSIKALVEDASGLPIEEQRALQGPRHERRRYPRVCR